MAKFLHVADGRKGSLGLGATIRIDSGEPCTVSCAQAGVRVLKSRFGFFGPVLYNERNVHQAALTARALNFLFPDSLLPADFKFSILSPFANAILHCSTCAEVAITLNEAAARAQEQGMQ